MNANLPVILMLLGAAAALQGALPSIPGSPLKIPLLAAVAFYYALDRQTLLSVVVALWAGILTDGLGGVPPGTSAVVLSIIVLVVAGLRQIMPEATWASAALLGAVGVPLLALLQVLVLRRHGAVIPFALSLAVSLLLQVPAGAVATGCLWSLGRRLDLRAGNIAPRKEIESRGG
jgi:cell shape-determining protein MreD